MALDSSNIILGFQAPQVKSAFQRDLETQRSALGRMQVENAFAERAAQQRALKEEQDTKSLIESAGGDLSKARDLLYGKGYVKQGQALDKTLSDRAESQGKLDQTRLDNAKKKFALMGDTFGYVAQNATPENAKQLALQGLDQLYSNGALTKDEYDKAVQTIPEDPAQIISLAKQHWQSAIDSSKQIGELQSQDLGGTKRLTRVLPDGQVKVLDTQNVTITPDQIEDNKRQDLQLGETQRHNRQQEGISYGQLQNSRDRLAFDKTGGTVAARPPAPPKPLPGPALKLQQEELDAIGNASSIDADLGAVENQIDNGNLDFGPVSNTKNKVLNGLGMSTEKSRNFGSFMNTLEKLRNDSLRLNKGVQTDGDAQRAWNELFSNINDTDLVSQRLKEIRKINQRAINLRKMNVDQIRGNYGAEPLDTSGYENQAPAIGNSGVPDKSAIQAEIERRRKAKGGQ